jgi:molybdate transport system substrate-binding protein
MVLLNFKNKYMQYAMLCCGLTLGVQVHAEQAITVYAAASLTNAIADVDAIFEQQKKSTRENLLCRVVDFGQAN